MPYPPEDFIDDCIKGKRATVREFGLMSIAVGGHYLKREIDVLHDKANELEKILTKLMGAVNSNNKSIKYLTDIILSQKLKIEKFEAGRTDGQTKTKD